MPSQGRIWSQPGQDMPLDMPGDMPQDNPPGMAGGMQQDMPQDVPQDNPPGMAGGMQHDMPLDMPQDNPTGMAGGIQHDMPLDVPQDNPSGMAGGMQQDMPLEVPQDNPSGMAGGIQHDMPLDMPHDNPPGMAGGMQQDMPLDMPQSMSPLIHVPVQETAGMGAGPGIGEEVVYVHEEQNRTEPRPMMQTVGESDAGVPPRDEIQAGAQYGGETQAGAQSGDGAQAQTDAGTVARPKTRRGTTVWAQAQYPSLAKTPQPGGVPDWALPQELTQAGADLHAGAWAQTGTRTQTETKSTGGRTVWAQAQDETHSEATPQSGEQGCVLPRKGTQTRAHLQGGAWAQPLDGKQAGEQLQGGACAQPLAETQTGTQLQGGAWAKPHEGTHKGALSQGEAMVDVPEGPLQPQASVKGQSGPGPPTMAGHAGTGQVGEEVWAQDEEDVWAQDEDEVLAQDEEEVWAQDEDEVLAQDEEEVLAQDEDEVLAQDEEEVWAQEGEEFWAQDWEEVLAQDEEEVLAQDEEEVLAQGEEEAWDEERRQREAQEQERRHREAQELGRRQRRNLYLEHLRGQGHHLERRGQVINYGGNVNLITNYFSVNFVRSIPLYQYHVEYNPPCESKRVRTALLYVHQELIGEVHVFNGTMLFLPRRLPNEVTEVHSTRQYDGVQIRLTITLRSELPPDAPQAIQVFNIILRRLLKHLGMEKVQRHHYDFESSVDITRYQRTILQVIPGVAASILPFEDRVLLNVDLTHKVIRTDTCLDVINREYMTQTNMDDVRRALIGCVVITRYNNRTYRVDDVNDSLTPTDTFRLTNGTTITFQEYFQQHYQITIVDQAQPLLMSRPTGRDRRRGQTGPIYLVPELCFITGLPDEMRLGYLVMKNVAVHPRIPPNDRVDKLLRFRNRLERNQQTHQELENWGFGFSETLLVVRGRILIPEQIIGGGNVNFSYNPKYGRWLHNKKPLVTVALRNWLILFPKKHDEIALHFVWFLERAGQKMDMQISHPTKIALDDDRNETYLRALRNSLTSDLQMVVCIVSDNKKDRYNAIKRFCTFPCQVVLQRTLAVSRLMKSMARNIAIQLNCKLGGEAWALDIPFVVPVMVIGIDTYPDMSMRNWSVCGVVCSMNTICTRFYSRVIFYESHDELINRLMPVCREALRFLEIRGVLPEKIFIYRDGVREGQLDAVVSRELPRVKEIFQQYRENYSPRLSFIVVNKQINTRLFIRTTDVENPPPGTVVDSVITKQECYNFFLVSESVNNGTVSPTQYTVIWDDTGLRREHLQRLTFKLTHLYYNRPESMCRRILLVDALHWYFLFKRCSVCGPGEVISGGIYVALVGPSKYLPPVSMLTNWPF